VFLVTAAVAAMLTAASCGGGGSSPGSPSAPIAVAPEPTPPPGDGGTSARACPIGKGDPAADCSKRSPRLLAAMDAALDTLVRDRPELFNRQEEEGAGTGQYRVLDQERYVDGLIANLRTAGLCAERALDSERVVVKSTNDFSEEWDALTSRGFIRRGPPSYQRTCEPAAFPVDAKDLIAYVRVSFFALWCDAGVVPPLPPEGKLPLGCDGFVTATPKLGDGRDVPSWIHGSEIQWELREGEDVVRVEPDSRFFNPFNLILRSTGRIDHFYLCATVQGREGCLYGQTIP
jgi:hypothetical protein